MRARVRLKPDAGDFIRSRMVARSGSSPMYQKIAEIVKYVLIAKKSQINGDRKLIHSEPRVFG